jgi:hypothetical protein
LVIDLFSPANADADTDEEDDNAVALLYWTTAWNSLLAMEAIAQEQNGEDNDSTALPCKSPSSRSVCWIGCKD